MPVRDCTPNKRGILPLGASLFVKLLINNFGSFLLHETRHLGCSMAYVAPGASLWGRESTNFLGGKDESADQAIEGGEWPGARRIYFRGSASRPGFLGSDKEYGYWQQPRCRMVKDSRLCDLANDL